jgi:predicted nucleic acid-binding protein
MISLTGMCMLLPLRMSSRPSISTRTGASFWGAMICRSAKELGCRVLRSEDLNPGQEDDGIQVRNPFLA